MRSHTVFCLVLSLHLCRAQDKTAAAPGEAENLHEVARAATAMIDGDVCTQIETARSREYQRKRDPRDPWRAADNYDVNAEPFIETKKILIRLARLCAQACDVNLWMSVPSRPDRVQIVIRNVHELSQFWRWGDMDQAIPPEMSRTFERGERVTVRRKPGMTAILTPVFDSLGNVTALAEVVSERNPDARENVK